MQQRACELVALHAVCPEEHVCVQEFRIVQVRPDPQAGKPGQEVGAAKTSFGVSIVKNVNTTAKAIEDKKAVLIWNPNLILEAFLPWCQLSDYSVILKNSLKFMKKIWVLIAVIVLIPLLVYIGRDRIKAVTQSSTLVPSKLDSPSPVSDSTNSDIIMIRTDAKGDYLIDTRGMALYTFDKDKPEVSNCNDSCATTWPPHTAGSPPQSSKLPNVTTIKRADGSLQYAYKGMPLYLYSKDKQQGDITGDGVDEVWHIVRL